ncbi:hypothetical protein [Cellulomonas biazotea]|jgi:hypothetical protein|uniref:Uncharacterized protein n=1 Tax=Cellulomonas biazotea TaxID=1709 RepID=A0A402DWI7_9CELL|nr:hypothetical protein [Cellulomonas biazotea]GCE78456.1 hypothetical protein CBZ_35120 [Cellulomonas biazotea]
MIIDCDSCAVRGRDCADCVVSFLTIPVRPTAVPDAPLRTAAGAVELDAAERHAIGVLAASGLVPPLRLVEAGRPARRQSRSSA